MVAYLPWKCTSRIDIFFYWLECNLNEKHFSFKLTILPACNINFFFHLLLSLNNNGIIGIISETKSWCSRELLLLFIIPCRLHQLLLDYHSFVNLLGSLNICFRNLFRPLPSNHGLLVHLQEYTDMVSVSFFLFEHALVFFLKNFYSRLEQSLFLYDLVPPT